MARAAASAIVGVATTPFGRLPGYNATELGIWAMDLALADAGLRRSDIDGLIVSRIPDYQHYCELTGLDPRFVQITPAQGRMSGSSIELAAMVIAAGLAQVVALVYGNDGRSAGRRYGGEGESYGGAGNTQWTPYGMTSPGALHALMFERHAHQYGTRAEHLAEIACTFRRHAELNPQAVRREPMSRDDYFAARYICEPLRRPDYCLINDGGVALIVAAADLARDLAQPPAYVRGYGQASALSAVGLPAEDFWHAPLAAAGRDSYVMAGVAREDVSALMIYDNFTPTVIFSLEGLGFCPVGEGGPYVAEGHLRLGGRHPANTSGGHLSESYMQGWALNVEAVRQLRGACGPRQVPDARLVQYVCASPLVTSILYGSDPQ